MYSEADRRDSIRRRIVDKCVQDVLTNIRREMVTDTHQERTYLQIAVIEALVTGIRLESMSLMMRREIATTAEQIL